MIEGFRKKIRDAAGKVCELVIPINNEFYLGSGETTAICTLSSIDLLEKISCTNQIMDKIAIAGSLLSENKGIDAIINFALEHPGLTQDHTLRQ